MLDREDGSNVTTPWGRDKRTHPMCFGEQPSSHALIFASQDRVILKREPTVMPGAVEIDRELFANASLVRLLSGNRSPPDRKLRAAHRAQLAFIVAWVPLALLALFEGTFLRSRDEASFILDIAAQARYVLALPLCAFASSLLAPRLASVARSFRDLGFVRAEDIREYEESMEAARRASSSLVAAALVILFAYSAVGALIYSGPSKLPSVPQWHFSAHSRSGLSLTGAPYSLYAVFQCECPI